MTDEYKVWHAMQAVLDELTRRRREMRQSAQTRDEHYAASWGAGVGALAVGGCVALRLTPVRVLLAGASAGALAWAGAAASAFARPRNAAVRECDADMLRATRNVARCMDSWEGGGKDTPLYEKTVARARATLERCAGV